MMQDDEYGSRKINQTDQQISGYNWQHRWTSKRTTRLASTKASQHPVVLVYLSGCYKLVLVLIIGVDWNIHIYIVPFTSMYTTHCIQAKYHYHYDTANIFSYGSFIHYPL
jgi:hypothetical protein